MNSEKSGLDQFNQLLEIKNQLIVSNNNQEQFNEIISYANSKYASVRNEVADLLSSFPGDKSLEILDTLMKDKNEQVRISALLSLQVIGESQYLVDQLFSLFESEKYILNKSYIISTIPHIVLNGNLDINDSIVRLYKLKEKYEKKYYFFHSIIYALIMLGEYELLDILIDELTSKKLERKLSILKHLRWIVQEFEENEILDKIFDAVEKTNRVNKKRFPYINYTIDHILSLKDKS